MDKIALLNDILEKTPHDTFARYGLAMEYSSRGELDASLAEFDRLLKQDPDYTPGYFMAAQTLVKAGRSEDARERLRQGIATAERTGNQHAEGEMRDMLDGLKG